MDRSPSFAEQLRQYREAAGMSQEELAERAGLSVAAVGALERGQRRYPYPHTVRVLAAALELSDDERAALIGAVPKRRVSVAPLAEQPATSLPIPLTPLVGRERELAELRDLFAGAGLRLLTLTGPGGVGKTRLALQLAAEIAERYRDGAAFVSLTPLADPALVIPAVGQVFGLQEGAGRSPSDALRSYLREKALLLVLDNFEHLLAAAPELTELLAACAEVTLLVTSRAPLHLIGEQEYPVPPLALPEFAGVPMHDDAAASPAVQLFVQRAREVSPAFALTPANAMAVAAICRRLDGLPLAIELAAAWVKLLPPTALLARLERRLPLLSGGPRDAPERQRTMRATVAWSYDLLTGAEQALFRRLSVFAGGWTIETAEAVCGGGEQGGAERGVDIDSPLLPDPHLLSSVFEGIASLLDKNLVVRLPDPQTTTGNADEPSSRIAEPRFGMLETVRAYGLEQLTASGEEEQIQGRHAGYFLALAEQAEPELTRAGQTHWLNRLSGEHDNLRAALAQLLARGEADGAAQLGWALRWFWYIRGHLREGREWNDRVLSLEEGALSPHGRARALAVRAMLAFARADYDGGAAAAAESARLAADAHDTRLLAFAKLSQANMAIGQEKWEDVRSYAAESTELYRALGESTGLGLAIAAEFHANAAQGDLVGADAILEKAEASLREGEAPWALSYLLVMRAEITQLTGRDAETIAWLGEAIALSWQIGDIIMLLFALTSLAGALTAREEGARAARLFGAAEALRVRTGALVGNAAQQSLYERHITTLRAQLAPDALAKSWAEGRMRSLGETIAEVLALKVEAV